MPATRTDHRVAGLGETRYRKVMNAPTVEDLKKAIAQLSERDKVALAAWMNASVIRGELLAADAQISRGEGAEYDENTLHKLFAETKASIANKLTRATMSAHFFLASLAAIGNKGLQLEEI